MIAYGGGRSGLIHRNVQAACEPKQPEPTKVCNGCERELPFSEYWTVKTKHGRSPQPLCKACERARKAEWEARRKGVS